MSDATTETETTEEEVVLENPQSKKDPKPVVNPELEELRKANEELTSKLEELSKAQLGNDIDKHKQALAEKEAVIKKLQREKSELSRYSQTIKEIVKSEGEGLDEDLLEPLSGMPLDKQLSFVRKLKAKMAKTEETETEEQQKVSPKPKPSTKAQKQGLPPATYPAAYLEEKAALEKSGQLTWQKMMELIRKYDIKS